jgi:hypothetical protein
MVNPEMAHALDDVRAKGRARLDKWTQDGTLVPQAELALAWHMQPEDIKAAVERGDLFEVWVGDAPYFPSELFALGPSHSFEICRQLGNEAASSKLIFLLRKHGGLGGKSVLEAMQAGAPLERILQRAETWTLT